MHLHFFIGPPAAEKGSGIILPRARKPQDGPGDPFRRSDPAPSPLLRAQAPPPSADPPRQRPPPPGGGPVRQDDGVPGLRQGSGDRRPDPPAPAGDQRNLPPGFRHQTWTNFSRSAPQMGQVAGGSSPWWM